MSSEKTDCIQSEKDRIAVAADYYFVKPLSLKSMFFILVKESNTYIIISLHYN